jgi:hypothetical protein
MKRQIKLQPREEQRVGEQQQSQDLEFASVEAMLRHDALHTPVPPSIAQRLRESLAQNPPPPRPWWRRLLGL